jgi:hypothetical protein
LSRGGSLSCYTCCDTGPRFIRSHLLRHTKGCEESNLTWIFTGIISSVFEIFLHNLSAVVSAGGQVLRTYLKYEFKSLPALHRTKNRSVVCKHVGRIYYFIFRSKICLCAERDLYRATPAVTWGHGFPVSSEGPPHSVALYDIRGDVEDLF